MEAGMTEPAAAEIEAATLVTFRRAASGGPPELLMVVRARELAFAGGMAVFPGGRVDPADRALAARLAAGSDISETAHRIAAVRETIEETGLVPAVSRTISAADASLLRKEVAQAGALGPVLDAHGLTLELDSLVPFARWCPRGMAHSRVFDTRFYLYDLGTGAVDLAVDATENTRLFWTSAADALARADDGELSVIFPTRRNLERLAQFASFPEARAHAEAHPVRTIIPQVADRGGRRALTIPEGLGYPVTQEPLDEAMRG
jgi:8-oxo-dGTP pyrophosphatase MutT (NUDIX family)